ncbi:MAG: S-methyl-5'-thioadenosine phosphorylase [bacterium]|nr:S-methyl-5'-thioadenosine phosphorylase [bacterium]
MDEVKIGIIGGSGLYKMEGLKEIKLLKVSTPFGSPSDEIVIGEIEGERIAFLPRHGRGHRVLPGEVNSLANIYALKSLGVERIIGVSAVGSLKGELRPLDIVIPDQLFDHTKGRPHTFFGNGIVVHIEFADPYCPDLNKFLIEICITLGYRVHSKGVYVCIEGPQFSTRAESQVFRRLGMDIIGMTNMPEAKLAREAEICYSTIAIVTDYDVWHAKSSDVTVDLVIKNLLEGVKKAKEIIKMLVPLVRNKKRECKCATALKDAIITNPKLISEERKRQLNLIIGRYIK